VQVAAEFGAVNTPELEMEPQEAAQVTGWLAEKDKALRACNDAVAGVTAIDAGVVVTTVLVVCPLPSVAAAPTVHVPSVTGAVYVPLLPITPHVADQAAGTLDVN
jgi:hypothetical protein